MLNLKYSKYLNITPLFYSVGDAAEQIFWGYARARLLGKDLNIISPYRWTQILAYKISNRELYKLVIASPFHERNVFYLSLVRLFVNFIFVVRRAFAIISRKYFCYSFPETWNFPTIGTDCYWPANSTEKDDYITSASDAIISEIHCLTSFDLRKKTIYHCKNKLTMRGIVESKKYICLHVRDAGFHQDAHRRPYRNADINNYKKGIEFLISHGFYVFRMGDASMGKLNIDSDKYIDYPFTDLKSEKMDLFLIKNCEFYIGMQSGIYDVALLFNKPVLLLNMYDWFFGYPFKSCDRGMLKKINVAGYQSPITFQERLMLPFNYTDVRAIHGDNIAFIEHDSNQIFLAIKEFFLDYKSAFSRDMSPLMKENYNAYKNAVRSILKNDNPLISNQFFSNSPVSISHFALHALAARGGIYDF